MKKYKILTIKEYLKVRYPKPYFFSVFKDNQYLYYVGARHTFDPNHPDLNFIEKKWKEFMESTKGKDCIVFVEGNARRYFKDADESVIKAGEGGYITRFALNNNIPTYCPEPPKEIELKELELKFSKEEIAFYYFIRLVGLYYKLFEKSKFNDFIENQLRRIAKELDWDKFDFSLDYMKRIHVSMFKKDFDLENEHFNKKLASPAPYGYETNDIAVVISNLRDNWIVGEIEKYWRLGKNIFVLFGDFHAVVQEPAIRDILI